MESTAVATRGIGMIDPAQTKDWALIFRKSGLFDVGTRVAPDVQEAQAQVKILAGVEMGLQPFFAMQHLHVVNGRVFVDAAAYGALVNGAEYAKFITKESTAQKAVIEFYRFDRTTKQWELVHTSTYAMQDAERAGRAAQQTYKNDPADMLWNRAMTKGAKKSFPELVGGMPSAEEAQDAQWAESNGNGNLIPETNEATPNVAANQTPEIAADEQTSVAATNEEPKKPPKSKSKSKAKDAAPAADPETGEIVDESVSTGESEFTKEASAAADMEAEQVTADQAQDIGWWIQGEKLPAGAILKAKGMSVPAAVSKANQAQYVVLKEAREAYIAALAEQNGWELGEGMALNEQQRAWIKAHPAEAKKIALGE